jgi:hypothetical protein
VIQAVPHFNIDQILPLELKVSAAGISTIGIETLENVPQSTEIYLFDNVTGIYHNIKNSDFTASLPIGVYSNRFSVRFQTTTLDIDQNQLSNDIKAFLTSDNNIFNIQNNSLDTTVKEVILIDMLGKIISNWDVENSVQTNIQIPIKAISSGIYIMKMKTTSGDLNKKIIIK